MFARWPDGRMYDDPGDYRVARPCREFDHRAARQSSGMTREITLHLWPLRMPIRRLLVHPRNAQKFRFAEGGAEELQANGERIGGSRETAG